MGILISVINQALIFSLVAIGVFLTSRVIKKDDLSVEGSFGLGGALTAVLLELHLAAPLTIIIATLVGGLVGCFTGFLYTRLHMNHLMAGLVSTTACFSLSLVMATATKNIMSELTIFSLIPVASEETRETVLLIVIIALVLTAVLLFLRSEVGLVLRASGDNPKLLVHFGKSASTYQTLGFALANSLTALAGSLFVQWSGFFSITGNIGTLVAGLASLMIAELFSRKLSFMIVVAAFIYQSIFAITLAIGIAPVWNNFIKAGVIVVLVMMSTSASKRRIQC